MSSPPPPSAAHAELESTLAALTSSNATLQAALTALQAAKSEADAALQSTAAQLNHARACIGELQGQVQSLSSSRDGAILPPLPLPPSPPSLLASLASFTPTHAELQLGTTLLSEILSIPTVNSALFLRLCSLLTPPSPSTSSPYPSRQPLPRQKLHASSCDGRMLELHVGILFHILDVPLLDCGGGRGDGGVDLLVLTSSSSPSPSPSPSSSSPCPLPTMVQCKQYASTIVGVDTIKAVIGSMCLASLKRGLLVVTSTVTSGVREVARRLDGARMRGELDMQCDVWDGHALRGLLGRYGKEVVAKRAELLAAAMADAALVRQVRETEVKGAGYCIAHAICRPTRARECDLGCLPWQAPPPACPSPTKARVPCTPGCTPRTGRRKVGRPRTTTGGAQPAVGSTPLPGVGGQRGVEEEEVVEMEGGEVEQVKMEVAEVKEEEGGTDGEGREVDQRGEEDVSRVEETAQRCTESQLSAPPPPTPPRLSSSAKLTFLTSPARSSVGSPARVPILPAPDPVDEPQEEPHAEELQVADALAELEPRETAEVEEEGVDATVSMQSMTPSPRSVPPAVPVLSPSTPARPDSSAPRSPTCGVVESAMSAPPVPCRLSMTEKLAIVAACGLASSQVVEVVVEEVKMEEEEEEGGGGGGMEKAAWREDWVEEAEALLLNPSTARTEEAQSEGEEEEEEEDSDVDDVDGVVSDDSDGVEGSVRTASSRIPYPSALKEDAATVPPVQVDEAGEVVEEVKEEVDWGEEVELESVGDSDDDAERCPQSAAAHDDDFSCDEDVPLSHLADRVPPQPFHPAAFDSANDEKEEREKDEEEVKRRPPVPSPRRPTPVGAAGVGRRKTYADGRKRRVVGLPWTVEEELEIRMGVLRFGEGKWLEVLRDGRVLQARGRSNINVKDKWRSMELKRVREAMEARGGTQQ